MGQVLKTNVSNQGVKEFWELEPCGTHFIDYPINTPEFYRQYAAFRYRTEWHIPGLVPFQQFADKDVLEIGLGLGTDGTQFAKHGACYTGVDLTETAVEATRLHFETLGYDGRFEVQNAEALTLADGMFDLVYSHGVLHHTAHIENAFSEISRVLKPNGRIIIMLYHRHSFNYYVRILGYMRLKVAFYTLLRQLKLRETSDSELEAHYQNYLQQGLSYFAKTEFPHHATDGANCPIANCYSRREVTELLTPHFDNIRFAVAHFPINKSLPNFPRSAEKVIASRIGWYLFIYGQKRG